MLRACQRCGLIYRDESEYCGIDGARTVATNVDPLVGRRLARYEIVERVAMGGVAALYRARHVVLGHDVAIKVLLGEMASRPIVAERFRREAQAACRIHHTNVVMTFDYGTTELGAVYLAMELLNGRTIAERIQEEGALAPETVTELVLQMARGLAAIHGLGFVHRDVKPANVMLVREDGHDHVKILDFGLVRVTGEIEPADRLTQQGSIMGTPLYMAPELISGRDPTPAADLYGLGATLYEMLSGRPPFDGTLSELLVKHLSEAPPALPARGELADLAMALLAKEPTDRPSSAEEVIQILEAAQERSDHRRISASGQRSGTRPGGVLSGPLDHLNISASGLQSGPSPGAVLSGPLEPHRIFGRQVDASQGAALGGPPLLDRRVRAPAGAHTDTKELVRTPPPRKRLGLAVVAVAAISLVSATIWFGARAGPSAEPVDRAAPPAQEVQVSLPTLPTEAASAQAPTPVPEQPPSVERIRPLDSKVSTERARPRLKRKLRQKSRKQSAAPPAESTPAQPDRVLEVRIESTPPGARVSTSRGVLGNTPLTTYFRASDKMNLSVELEGFAPTTLRWSEQSGTAVSVALSRSPPP